MKRTIATLIAIAASSLLPLSADTTETTDTDVHRNPDGSTTTTKTTTTTFTPNVQTKVVKYFDHYKSDPHGLPPAWVTSVKIEKIPATWKTTRIVPGVTIQKAEREYLFKAPTDLVKLLPEPSDHVTYYVAGSNVVAVDSDYKVVDSIRIPTVKFTMD